MKIVKFISTLLVAALLGMLLTALALTCFVNPNDYKPLIISQFKKASGYDITIPGDLSWKFFPLGVKASEVQVKNANKLAMIAKDIKLRVQFLPLLHREIVLSKVRADQLQLNHILLTSIGARLNYHTNFLEIHPFTAHLYDGKLYSDLQVSWTQNQQVTYHVVGNIKNVDTAALLINLMGTAPKLNFTSRAEITFDVSTQGKNVNQINQDLNGATHFILSEGALQGIDIGYFVDMAVAIVNKQSPTGLVNTNKTDFGQLSGTATFKNGIATTDDLSLDAPRYTVKGNGTVNLLKKTIDLHLNVTAKPGQQAKLLALYDKTIPIRVVGELNHPYVSLDTVALMQTLGKEKLQEIEAKVQKAIPEKANDFLNNILH